MKINYGVLIKADTQDISNGTIIIPSDVNSIADDSIRDMKELYHIEIPQGVTQVGNCAFACCTNLTSVTIPDSLIDIHPNAFFDCKNLKCFDVDSNNPEYSSDETGVLYNKNKTTLIIYPQGKSDKSFRIPNSVLHIGDKAFKTFGDVIKLTEITLSDNLLDFPTEAFSDLSCITKIIVNSNYNFYSDESGVLYNSDKTLLICYPRGKMDKSYHIPNGVMRIGEYAFSRCKNLEHINLPESTIIIDKHAFYACYKLSDCIIPDNVNKIGEAAFSDCYILDNIIIPSGVKTIQAWTFQNCTGLINISIPASVKYIDKKAFANCKSLEEPELLSDTINVEETAFEGCNFKITSPEERKERQKHENEGDLINTNSNSDSNPDHHEVFITNTPADQMTANIICNVLEFFKIRCWIAPRDVTPNRNFHLCAENAIKSSKVVVMVLSQSSDTSMTILEELALANQYGVKIIPFDSVNFKPDKLLLSPANFMANPNNPISKYMFTLIREIKEYISSTINSIPGDESNNVNNSEQIPTNTARVIEETSPAQEVKQTVTDIKSESELKIEPGQSQQNESKKLIFISANSKDYDMAGKIYRYLTENHVDAFFAAETLKRIGNADYRNQIDDFLDRCDHMIVVTSSKDNVRSSWVEAEWGFFINEKRSGRKPGNIITITTAEVKIGDLPPSLRYYEVIGFESGLSEGLLQYLI
jgi:hypothetical protein